jgi:hypothetical protein
MWQRAEQGLIEQLVAQSVNAKAFCTGLPEAT